MSRETSVDSDLLDGVPVVNTEELAGNWREAPRTWGHSMHKLAPYVGGFPPALANYFINRYTNEGDRVLDPFCGGGTTPFEALRLGRDAIGNDAFTYAHVLAHAKCNPLPQNQFEQYIDDVFCQAQSLQSSEIPSANSDVEIFFHEQTLDQLLRLKKILNGDSTPEAIFLKAIISGILHGPSQRFLSVQTKDTFSGTPNYVRKYIDKHDLTPSPRDVKEKVIEKYNAVIDDGLPEDVGTIYKGDARSIPAGDESVDFVLTSPPYMHVLDYTWNNWLRLWWLDEEKDDERDDLVLTADLDKYHNFVSDFLSEMYRLLSEDSRAVIVIGDVKKHLAAGPQKVRTARIIAKEAEKVGFEVEMVIDDAYGIEKRAYKKFNEIRYETESEDDDDDEELIDRCVVLSKGSPTVDNEVTPDW